MARTHGEIIADALKLTDDGPVVITHEEARGLVDQHIAMRVASGRQAPDRNYVNRKLALMKIAGRAVEVQ